MSKPRLLLAEDHELVGQGYIALLGTDYDVVATVADGAQVIETAVRHRPDVLLLDLSLPNRTGIDLLPELRAACPEMHILIVSMHVDPHLVDMTMKLGAAGFVPKNAKMAELRTAIEEVRAGRKYVSSLLPRRSYSGAVADPMGFSRLTPRQQEIVRMIAKGMRSEEIAEQIGLSVWTVNFHRRNIRRVLGVHNDLEMYRYAILAGEDPASADDADDS